MAVFIGIHFLNCSFFQEYIDKMAGFLNREFIDLMAGFTYTFVHKCQSIGIHK